MTLALAISAVTTLAFVIAGLRRHPVATVVLWLGVACFIPYWVTVPGRIFVPASVLVGLLAVLALWKLPRPLIAPDRWMTGLAFAVLLAAAAVVAAFGDAAAIVGQWSLGYLIGRLIGGRPEIRDRIGEIFALLGAAVGALAIVEFVADWHPFEQLGRAGLTATVWAPIQYRGDLPRSEWVFGHSIALGNVLAMTLPFVLVSKRPVWQRLCMGALVVGGVAASLSRNAMLAAVLAVALSLVLLGSRIGPAARRAFAVAGALALCVLVPVVVSVLGRATGEVAYSNTYRLQLVSVLPTINWWGESGTKVLLEEGRVAYLSPLHPRGLVESVDNTFVLLGLEFGWVVLAVLLALLTTIVLAVRRTGVSPEWVAVVSQLPTLMTVALITQYSIVFWALAGIAVSSAMSGRRDEISPLRPMRGPPRRARELLR